MGRKWVTWNAAAACSLLLSAAVWIAPPTLLAQPMPQLVQQDGRATLMVDGASWFILGAQVDNSSGWPQRLDAVWPAAEALRLNTLEVPVYWEQLEPKRGAFDFTVVDSILQQARAHNVRLVLLWFGTWKNGKMHYVPDWVKSDPATYPRMLSKSGVPIDVLSPNAPANLDADRTAFAALMRHLKQTDPQHTVLVMQVETSAQLPPTPTPPAQAPATPPGPQVVPPAIEAALNKVIPRRAVTLDAPDTALKVNTRYLEDASVYFFFNEGAQPISHTVTLWAGGSMKVEAWDPATGTVSPLASTPGTGSVTLKLDLKPYETNLITIQ